MARKYGTDEMVAMKELKRTPGWQIVAEEISDRIRSLEADVKELTDELIRNRGVDDPDKFAQQMGALATEIDTLKVVLNIPDTIIKKAK